MTIPVSPNRSQQSVIPPARIAKEAEVEIRSASDGSLKEPVETVRELLGWTMELLSLLAIPLSAQPILPPSAYPYPGMRKDIQEIDQWIRQTRSHLGSLNLGLRGCSLIFWSELIVAKRKILSQAQTELNKLLGDPKIEQAQQKITAALEDLEKEEKSYLEQKRSWGYRAFQQGLRITQPYLKQMGRAAPLALVAKATNYIFTWTISAFGLLFSGQAFKKSLTDWRIYKKGSTDFEERIRFPQSIKKAETAETVESENVHYVVLDIHNETPLLEDQENKVMNIVNKWDKFVLQIIPMVQSIQKLRLTEEGLKQYLEQHFGLQDKTEIEAAEKLIHKDLENLVNASDVFESMSYVKTKKLDATAKKCLAKIFLNQQQTRLHAVKNGLLEMVSAKQRMEGAFLKIKLGSTGSIFTISTLQFVAQLALLILGLATISFGGAGVILFWLGVASFAATGAVSLSSTYYVARRRYHRSIEEFKLINARIFYTNLRKNIARHRLARYGLTISKQDETFNKMQRKVEKWKEKEDSLRERLARANWQDFAEQHLYQWQKWGKPEEVVLQELSQALRGIDPQLLSKESNKLLQEYFGIQPEHFSLDSDAIKKQLRRFFTFDDSDLVKFMKAREIR